MIPIVMKNHFLLVQREIYFAIIVSAKAAFEKGHKIERKTIKIPSRRNRMSPAVMP